MQMLCITHLLFLQQFGNDLEDRLCAGVYGNDAQHGDQKACDKRLHLPDWLLESDSQRLINITWKVTWDFIVKMHPLYLRSLFRMYRTSTEDN